MTVLRTILNLVGAISSWSAKHLRKKINGKPPIPKLETDIIEYVYGRYHFSNQKIKDAGFQFKYLDRRIGLIETFKWYDEHGWKQTQH